MQFLLWRKVKVILWKNLLLRKHHWTYALIEITGPTVFMLILYVLALEYNFMNGPKNFSDTYNPQRKSSDLYKFFNKQFVIAYTPSTNFTKALITTSSELLGINASSVQEFNNETMMNEYLRDYKGSKIIGVVFSNLADDLSVPCQFHYVIRPYKYVYLTKELFRKDEEVVPDTGSLDYFRNGFIPLKIALDINYIKMFGDFEQPIEIVMQEFPYPPFFNELIDFKSILPHWIFISYIGFYLIIMHRIVEEKESGSKQLMVSMGLQESTLWLGWFLDTLLINICSSFILTCLLKCTTWGDSGPLVKYANGFLLFLFLLLYTVAGTVFIFALTSFVSKNTTADILGFIVLVVVYILGMRLILNNLNLSRCTKIGLILFPHFGLYFGFDAISVLDKRKIGLEFNNLFTCSYGCSEDIEIGYVLLMFIIDIFLYFLITLLVEKLIPGPYGIPIAIDFPFKKLCKFLYFKKSDRTREDTNKIKFYKVDVTPNLAIGVHIKNLTKKYNRTLAVNDLTMDIYQGEITTLVGHSGAGKSTLMCLITGMLSATSGEVYIQDRNIKRVINTVKAAIGYCPQNNLKFLSLSVKEHLVFFGILKGLGVKDAYETANMLLVRLNLYEQRHEKAYKLLDESQRKLSLAIALSGNSKILILDEPTFGLDLESRQAVWDILRSMKSTRVIVVSTQSMEEAEIFGDRIAIMCHGCLICYGPSTFLKKEFGANYQLQITFDETWNGLASVSKLIFFTTLNSHEEEITSIVHNIIPTATFQSKVDNTLTFSLPYESKSEYSKLLDELDLNMTKLSIKNVEVKASTIEDVFKRMDEIILKNDYTTAGELFQESDVDETDKSFIVSTPKKEGKSKKIMNHWQCLIMKKYWIEKRRWCSLLTCKLLVIMATIVSLILTDNSISINKVVDNFFCNLNAYSETKVFYSGLDSLKVANYKNQYRKLILNHTTDVHEVPSVSIAILKEGKKDIGFYRRNLVVAVEFNLTKSQSLIVNAMYSNPATHGAPISLNLIVNTILKIAKGENYSISAAINFSPSLFKHKNASATRIPIFWTILLPFAFLIYCERFLFLPLTEKRTKLKHLQLMCGVRSLLYWTVCYVWDLFIYLLAVTFVMLIIVNFNDVFSKPKEIQMLFLILLAYGLSMISYIYVYSHCFVKKASCTHFIVSSLTVSFLMGSALNLMHNIEKFVKFLSCLFVMFPQFGLFYCILKFSSQAVWNYNFKNEASCTNKHNKCCEDDIEACKQYQSYFFGQYGICCQLTAMYISTILYLLMMTILEAKFTSRWSEKRLVHLNKKLNRLNVDENTNVLQEYQRILNVYTEEQKRANEMLEMYKSNTNVDFYMVNNIKKMYNLIRVVKGISFGLNRGDCFGVVGDTGSGKTTIFRVLTGMSLVNIGGARIYANDKFYYLYKNDKKYLQYIGYCPQNNVCIDILTGRELLYFFAKIRGVTVQTKSEVTKWINLIGLEDCADKLCRYYSSGNKRKLSVGVALIGSPLIVMLDEPTTGIDPISQKRIWKVIKTIQNQNFKPCIIIASKNVEECEALCDKMAILVNGQFKCFATTSNIKDEYANGFIIKIKLNISMLSTPRTGSDKIRNNVELSPSIEDQAFNLLMHDCREMFAGCITRQDKYMGLINYHVKDRTKKWNDLFKDMGKLKNKHIIIEDYDITGARLEDVFATMSKSTKP